MGHFEGTPGKEIYVYDSALVEQCKGCLDAKQDGSGCKSYAMPEAKWEAGKRCPRFNDPTIVKEVKEEKHIDPIKKSKKMMGK